jgi:phosphoglycolate phosphatase-like HAD superfamily hydrolase
MSLIVTFILFFHSLLSAEIFEVKHFAEIKTYLLPETLIILDIDDTLLVPKQMLGSDEWFQRRLKYHEKEEAKDALEKTLAEWEAIRHLTEMELVEPGIETIIHQLTIDGYPIMCLTTQGLALATRTQHQLLEHQIDISKCCPFAKDVYYTNNNHGLLFRNGILFTSGTHKGQALFGLLKTLNLTPQRILFVNDKRSHLLNVEETAKEKNIPFIGLRYGYSDERKAAYSEAIADYEWKHSTFSHLLSDKEAKNLLEKTK